MSQEGHGALAKSGRGWHLPVGRGGRSPAAPAHRGVRCRQGGGGARNEAELREGARQARLLPARILFHLLMGEMCP